MTSEVAPAAGARPAARVSSGWALAVVLGSAAVRFAPFLVGGTVYRRDAGFFFVPWRMVLARLLAARELPVWNEWMSAGRPFAADPNAAVFWPLSPLLLVLSPSALSLLTVFLVLTAFFFGLRRLGLSPEASAGGTLVLLFSGVFQSLPSYMTMCAAVLPLPLAFAEVPRLSSPDRRVRRRALALCALAFGLSALAGEPGVTLIGAVAFLTVLVMAAVIMAAAAANSRRPKRGIPAGTLSGIAALALGAGLAAVQICPTLLELSRSARVTDTLSEGGALFRSVRPGRALTLLEPRLGGDPAGGSSADWGTGTFDARSPYFDDLALGILPILFAAAAWRDGRGRAALLLAFAGALLACGRFLPGVSRITGATSLFRYPEKWWLLVTFALAAAAAVGVDQVFSGTDESKERARRVLLRAAVVLALVCGTLFLLAAGAEGPLRSFLWAMGLGTGPTPAAIVATVLRPPLLLGSVTLVLVTALLWFVARNRLRPAFFAAVLSFLFLADATRRVAGTCPAGPSDLYRRERVEVALVRATAGAGRFYDDGSADAEMVARRTGDAGGLDPLLPSSGVAFGIRYAGENDIDRMTYAPSLRFAGGLAALPWGEEKAARLRLLGVHVVRTAAPPPDPRGVVEVGRFGADRILRIDRPRQEFAVLPEGGGSVTILERGPSRARLRVKVALPVAMMAMGRTFDPNWHARLDGVDIDIRPSDASQMALDIPGGVHEILVTYENPAFLAGGALSAASLAALVLLAVRSRE